MKRIPFLRRPITHKFKRPHSKAEEPDCLSPRNPPSIMITTQSPKERERGGGDNFKGFNAFVLIYQKLIKLSKT
jgi:hypothetical protein